MSRTRSMRSFDPVVLGRAECEAWVYYYRREWGRFLRTALLLVREGFGMPWPRTVLGAWYVLRGNQLWAPYPDNDPDGARTAMRRFYGLLARHQGLRIDPRPRALAMRLSDAWVADGCDPGDERLPQERLLLVESYTRLLDLVAARAQVQ